MADLYSFRDLIGDDNAKQLVQAERIEDLIKWLKSLHGGEHATFALIDCGRAAVPALRRVLYECDPSGIFEPRCRAARALAAIGERELLLQFLDAPHDLADPVARLGEEAAINTVARALTGWHTNELYEKLLSMARRQLLPGVIEALADFGRDEAIPILVAALADDFSRAPAEDGLRKLGIAAQEALIETAKAKEPSPEWESPSSLRRRRSALQLLLEIDGKSGDWPRLRCLLYDGDPTLVYLACKFCLSNREAADGIQAIMRLIALLRDADWFLASEIEDCLVQNFSATRRVVDHTLKNTPDLLQAPRSEMRLVRRLHRVKARGEASA